MKRTIVISFLLIYLLSITELHELLKFPVLVQHFSEHKKKDKKITFWKFLCIHYTHKTIKDNDFDKDSKLPFKNTDNCNSSNHISLLPELKFNLNAILVSSEKKVANKHYLRFTYSTFLKTIWQPPKFV
jgi:hypothetical protein